MPTKEILKFIEKYRSFKIGIFLHTSVVLETKANFDAMISFSRNYNVKFWLPENCYYELRLLSLYSSKESLKNKAARIIEAIGSNIAWSYNDMYKRKERVPYKHHYNKGLFVFYEPTVACEFSKKFSSSKNDQNFVLSFDPYYAVCAETEENKHIYISDRGRGFLGASDIYISKAGKEMPCRCIPLNNTVNLQNKKDTVFHIKNADNKTVLELTKADLKFMDYGGEGEIFTTPKLPGQCVKIYDKFCPSEHTEKKLKFLMFYDGQLAGGVFPTNLIYCGDHCVGFVMKKCSGKNLRTTLNNPQYQSPILCNNSKRLELIKRISAVLLEMRINQISVSDLSLNNIFILNDGSIKMIDTDSMEVLRYPGGGVTPPFGHPEVTSECFYKKLRTSEQKNFSYAVLLFNILFGVTQHPLMQADLDNPEWKKDPFPYTNKRWSRKGCVAFGARVNPEKLRQWQALPEGIRKGFIETFSFNSTYDIGDWIKYLK